MAETVRRGWGSRAAGLALVGGILLAPGGEPARGATFGVPTNLNATTGQVCTAVGAGCPAVSANPQGFFLVAAVGTPPAAGDVTNQVRLFVEVTGTTLDARVFDPGLSGARDDTGDGDGRTTFQLLDPCTPFPTCTGAVRSQVANLNNDNASTEDRLARFTPGNNGFFALNDGNANNVPFTALPPGLYEFRVTSTAAGDEANFFGVDLRDAAGVSLRAYTIGRTAAADSSMIVGSHNAGAPPANITQPILFYSFVDRGCGMQTSNFDMDVNGVPGAGSSGSILDVLAASTGLTMSDQGDGTGTPGAHVENAVVVEPSAGLNAESTNYGMYALTNNVGTQQNWTEWRMADFLGWTDNPVAGPPNPTSPLRMYLPDRSAIGSGAVVTAPAEPVLRTSLQYRSGPNPPSTSGTTRFALFAHLDNLTALPITNALVSIGVPAPAAVDTATLTAYLDGALTTCSSSTITPSLVQCTFASVAADQTATVRFEVTLAPPAPGTYPLTGPPVAGSPPPNSTARAAYSSAFGTTENLGPLCDLRVDTVTIITRASLRGVRVDRRGLVEFATATQQRTREFNVYGVADARGRGGRVLLSHAPIPAALPDSLTPILYRASTRPVLTPFLVIEEVEHGGRRREFGPFPVGDPRLRALLERTEQRLERAGAVSVPGRGPARLAPGRTAARLVETGSRPIPPPRREARGVKIEVEGRGRVRVALAELHENGLPPDTAAEDWRLTSQGRPVPFQLLKDEPGPALAFEAEALSTAYTGRNVFVLTWKARQPQLQGALTRWDEPPRPGFRRVETNSLFVPSTPQGQDPWRWDLLLGNGSEWPYAWDADLGDFDLPGLLATTGPVSVRLRLAGWSAHSHHVQARINGVAVGDVVFFGAETATLQGEVPGETLRSSGNRLELVYTASTTEPGDLGLAYLDFLELGLPDPPPAEMAPVRLGSWDPRLPAAAREADYLVVTHPWFEEQAQRIAALKAASGHRATVVSVERAYDRFSAGIVEAGAVRALLQELGKGGTLRHVLLLGDDSFDPRDLLGLGLASLVPSLYAWDGQFGRVPSENLYADLDGDGRPELAIGRLPAQTAEEATSMAEKIARQDESVRRGGGRHLFGIDNDTTPVSFRALADSVAAGLPPGAEVTWADAGQGLEQARATLLAELARGSLVTHVFGHGGPEIWADEALATVEDIESLEGSLGEGVVLQWACESQWFQYPLGPTIGEALVLRRQGGALASFGPAGITDIDLQVPLYSSLYAEILRPGVTLGEAIRRAKAATLAAQPRTRPAVEGWNLLGDPALVLRRGPRTP